MVRLGLLVFALSVTGLSAESRHLGYPFQRFALAATVVVVSVVLTLRARVFRNREAGTR